MSGRIRSIKPELLEDAVTAGITDAAFRLYIGAYLVADDYGNFRADPRKLKGDIFWARDEVSVEAVEFLLMELWLAGREENQSGLFYLFTVRGQRYGHVRNWEKHQKVDHRGNPRCPKHDAPESVEYRPTADHSAKPRELLGGHSRLISDLDLDLDHRSLSSVSPTTGSAEPATSAEPSQSTPIVTPSTADAAPLLLHPGEPTQTTREREVFDHWVTGWRQHIGGPRVPKLDDKRRGKIRARLREGYTVDDLKRAIDGLWASSWHLGDNPAGRRYTDIELVCRDATHVDRFISDAEAKTVTSGPAPEPEPVYGDPVDAPEGLLEKLEELTRRSLPPILAAVLEADAERGSDVRIATSKPDKAAG